MSDIYKDMPKSVHIGCFDYRIVVMGGQDHDNERIYGDMNAHYQRIRLGGGLNAQRLANTFIHEVLHAIHNFHGVGDDATEEETTYLTANGLCAFWQDNPDACKWWAKINAMGAMK